ncbi:30S ribosomal protein S19e [Candidatus Woesearchaeota archaeon]|nr:30S ribosomal protein S19e [Candidatus Woesearchaeota archaeon]
MSIHDVYPNELIEKTAEELKKIEAIKPPTWSVFAKTGAHKERAPLEKDWWYTRAAAILRTICILGPIGVSKLRTKYGGKKRRGHKKAHFRKGSGSVIRKILQQLEKAELAKFVEKDVHKGRIAAPKGKALLDKTAAAILKSKENKHPKKKKEKTAEDKEEKKSGKEEKQKAKKNKETEKKKENKAKDNKKENDKIQTPVKEAKAGKEE